MWNWQQHPYEILGLLVGGIAVVIAWLQYRKKEHQAPTVKKSWLHGSPIATGSNISQTLIREQHIRHTAATSPDFTNQPSANFSQARYDEWCRLQRELRASTRAMGYAFVPIHSYRPGDLRSDPDAAIQRGYDALQSCLLITDALKTSGIGEKWDALVLYIHSMGERREPNQQGTPSELGFELKANEFLDELGRVAREDLSPSAGADAPPMEHQLAKTKIAKAEPNTEIPHSAKIVAQGMTNRALHYSPEHEQGAEVVGVAVTTNDAHIGRRGRGTFSGIPHAMLQGKTGDLSRWRISDEDGVHRYRFEAEYPQVDPDESADSAELNLSLAGFILGEIQRFRAGAIGTSQYKEKEMANWVEEGRWDRLSIRHAIGAFTSDVLSVEFRLAEYGAGAAHSRHTTKTLNYLLKPTRRLEFWDIFRHTDKQTCLDTISRYCTFSINEQKREYFKDSLNGSTDWALPLPTIEENFKKLLLERGGVRFFFDPYSVGCYAEGRYDVFVPVRALSFVMHDPIAGLLNIAY